MGRLEGWSYGRLEGLDSDYWTQDEGWKEIGDRALHLDVFGYLLAALKDPFCSVERVSEGGGGAGKNRGGGGGEGREVSEEGEEREEGGRERRG